MFSEKMVKASLSLVEGKHTQPPNLVVVPAGVKRFAVEVEWAMQSEESYVLASHDPEDAHRWCVLDADLAQVMRGSVKGRHGRGKKAEPLVSRTLHGGGAHNPRTDTLELTASRLKNGATYTLIASRHGMIAGIEFVAVRQAKPRAVKKRAAVKKKAAPKAKKKTTTTRRRKSAA